MKKRINQKVAALAGVSILTLVALSATAETAASWGVANSAGAGLTVIDSGNAATISFAAKTQANSIPTRCDLLVGGGDPASAFSGDISGYTGIRFKINGDGHLPSTLKLVIHKDVGDGTSRDWEYPVVAVSTNAGEWMVNLVPLDCTKGWSSTYSFDRYRPGKDTPEYWWPLDLQDFDMLIVRIAPSGMDAQTYSVDHFQLIGADGTPTEPAQLTPLMEYFGVNSIDELTDAQKKQDSDGDGMSDLREILAGMDPNDASSVFRAVCRKSGTGNKVRWQGVLGAKYAIWRSTELTGGFELIGTKQADITGVIDFDDPNPVVGKANFYKVVKY